MFRPKPFLIGFFICFSVFLHVQPLFGGVVKTETKVKAEEKVANEENGNEGEEGSKKIGSLEEKSKSAEDSKKKENEEEIKGPENVKAKEHSGAENEKEKIFEETIKKDIDALKEHLEHEKHEGKHGLDGNSSDPKEIIHYMLVHLENIEMGCDRQKQFDWECGALSQIRNEEVKWLDFLLNRESFEKGDLKYLAVRPVVKKNTQKRGNFPEMWEDVGLKEVLEAIEKYNKNERPSVDFSLHNDEECSLVQRMVHELKEGEEHKNEEKIKKAKEAIRVFWEKEREVVCGKSFKFKEEEHNKKMETHKAQKWTKVFPSRSRLAMQQQEMEAKSRKEGGHNNNEGGNKEGGMKLEMEEEEEGEGVKGHQGENKGEEEKKGKEAKTKEKKAESASGAAEEHRGNGGAGKEGGGGMHRNHH